VVRLAGAPNFRDIGGFEVAPGLRVRRGRIFRSQLLADVTGQDLAAIRRLEIGAVLDLRDADERHRRNRWPREMTIQAIQVDAPGPVNGVRAAQLKRCLQDPAFEEARARALVISMYRDMPQVYAPHLAALFEWLAESSRPPLLIHCEAGKDRTGFVCAVLLLAMGVPLESVLAEYLLSRGRYRWSALRKLVGGAALRPHARRALHVLATVDAEYLSAALSEIGAHHGSVEAYLRRVAGVTRAQLRAVKSNVLQQR
jgi:protein-tyrosine phosphatase